METVDTQRLAAEFLLALRGRRSQRGFSRRLGYRTNIAYRWESGRCWPTACKTFEALERLGLSPVEKLRGFYAREPSWLRAHTRPSAELVSALLRDLRGQLTLVSLAERSGFSRFQLARWLSGAAEPRLPELLQLVEALSLRLVEFVSLFFDPALLPSIAPLARRHEALRQAAYAAPWSHAVLRAVELDAYRRLPRHTPGWLAARLGIAAAEEQQALKLLSRAGQVRWDGRRYRVAQISAVDTRKEPERSRALRAFWIEQARARMLAQQPGLYSYNLFSVSERDLRRISELHSRYYREMRTIVAESQPGERVALFCTQLLPLDAGPWPG
jgi:transcriptional regulator with XRE-family HTH domain